MDPGEASTSVSSVEVYGFCWWITSAVAYAVYLLWAYTPEEVLHRHGITYYPSKHWAVALPSWAAVTVVYLYWAYESLNMISAQQHPARRALRIAELERPPGTAPASKLSPGGRGAAPASGGEPTVPPLEVLDKADVSRLLHGATAASHS